MGGGIGMGNTCKPLAVSFQCMTKSTTNKKIKKLKKKKTQPRWANLFIKGSSLSLEWTCKILTSILWTGWEKKPNQPLIEPPSLISYHTSCPLGWETASWLGYQVSNRIRALSSPSTKSRGSESTVGTPAWMHSACCPRKGDTDFDASGKS